MSSNRTFEIVTDRSKVYGNFGTGSRLLVSIVELILAHHKNETGKEMPKLHEKYISDIVNKLSRLATTPTHLDSWDDIAGYATRIVEDLRNADK